MIAWFLAGIPVALAVYAFVAWEARRAARRLHRRNGCPCPVYQECIDFGCSYRVDVLEVD